MQPPTRASSRDDSSPQPSYSPGYAAWVEKMQKNFPKYKPAVPKPPERDFTYGERTWLLRNVGDELLRRQNPDWSFKVWCRYGLSRLYFLDDSWLSYGADGRCIYGRTDEAGNSAPDKTTAAFEVRTALGLKTPAKRGTISG
jgi:hypothetical protein